MGISNGVNTILILHGWGGSSRSWSKVKEILEKQSFNVFTPDLPGFGTTPPPPEPWNVEKYAEWVKDFCEKQRLSQFFLLGHSFGGQIATRFATTYPVMLQGLIFCSSVSIRIKPNLKAKIIIFLAKFGNAVFAPKILARFKDSARNLFYSFLRNRDYVKANAIMKETMKNVLAEDLSQELSKISAKTLLIWGAKDKLVPKQQAYIFKNNIKNSEIEILQGIGHSPHLECPGKLAEIIINFCAKFNKL